VLDETSQTFIPGLSAQRQPMPPHDHAAGKYCLKPHLKTKDKKRRFSRCVDDDETRCISLSSCSSSEVGRDAPRELRKENHGAPRWFKAAIVFRGSSCLHALNVIQQNLLM